MKFFTYAVGAVALAAVALADKTKDELLKDAEALKALSGGAIEKLKAEGKHFLAQEIEFLEHEVELLEKKVHDFHPMTPIGQIGLHAAENILHGLEEKLKKKIHDLEGTFDKTKDELLKDAAALKLLSGGAIEKLKAEGKHFLAQEIEFLEHEVELLEKKVHDFHPMTPIGQIGLHAAESILHGLEEKLKKKIHDLEGTFDKTKDELLKDAAALKLLSGGAIEKLKAEGKHFLAQEIEFLEHEVELLEKKVHDFHPQTPIGQIGLHAAENLLHGIEEKLKKKIHDLEGTFDNTKDELLKDANKLKEEARSAIEKLKAEGKHFLAVELEGLEKAIEGVEATVHKIQPTSEIGKVALHAAESLLHGLEDKLKAEISKLNH